MAQRLGSQNGTTQYGSSTWKSKWYNLVWLVDLKVKMVQLSMAQRFGSQMIQPSVAQRLIQFEWLNNSYLYEVFGMYKNGITVNGKLVGLFGCVQLCNTVRMGMATPGKGYGGTATHSGLTMNLEI